MTSPAAMPAKFLFDTPLDGPTAPPPLPHDKVEAMKAAHAAELERVRREAHQQGVDAGRKEALAGVENTLARQLETLAGHRIALEQRIEERQRLQQEEALRLALTAAERLTSGFVSREPQAQIEHFFKNCLSLLPTKIQLQLHVAPQLADIIGPRLETLIARSGRHNTLEIFADGDIAGADCRILWSEGGIEQSRDRILAEIERLLEAYLAARASRDTTFNNESQTS